MAHFARVENGLVTNVLVLNNDVIAVDGVEDEQLGRDFLANLVGGDWVQTSYSGSFRKNYAGIGHSYDVERNAFIPPKPFESWVLDEETCQWEPPKPRPTGSVAHHWDEEAGAWVEA